VKDIYGFLKHHVDLYNCGVHDMDNSFLHKEGLVEEFAAWQGTHEDCVPIGICKENCKKLPGMRYYAMVFEDERGGRYYTHVPGYWEVEYDVFDKGAEAMEKARSEWYRQWESDYVQQDKVPIPRDKYLCDVLDLGGLRAAYGTEDEDTPTEPEPEPKPEPEPEPEPVPEQPEKKPESQPDESAAKVRTAYFTCDALHSLEVAHALLAEAGETGAAMGLQFIHGLLQKIAARAIELDDKKLHVLMLKLHLYDVDNPSDVIAEINQELEKEEKPKWLNS